jgi:hypothetical protein
MLLASFNSSKIIRVEIGFFREPFQAPMPPVPLFADGGTEHDTIIRWHNPTRKQSLPRITTPLNGWFDFRFLLAIVGWIFNKLVCRKKQQLF